MVVMKRWSVALVILVAAFLNSPNAQAVSYTHLTLPTIYSV